MKGVTIACDRCKEPTEEPVSVYMLAGEGVQPAFMGRLCEACGEGLRRYVSPDRAAEPGLPEAPENN